LVNRFPHICVGDVIGSLKPIVETPGLSVWRRAQTWTSTVANILEGVTNFAKTIERIEGELRFSRWAR